MYQFSNTRISGNILRFLVIWRNLMIFWWIWKNLFIKIKRFRRLSNMIKYFKGLHSFFWLISQKLNWWFYKWENQDCSSSLKLWIKIDLFLRPRAIILSTGKLKTVHSYENQRVPDGIGAGFRFTESTSYLVRSTRWKVNCQLIAKLGDVT